MSKQSILRLAMTVLTAHGRTVRSFEALVNQLGSDSFASPKRSTVPLFDYWRVPESRLHDMTARFGLPWSDRFELHFESKLLPGAAATR